jgi:hypothetical protein
MKVRQNIMSTQHGTTAKQPSFTRRKTFWRRWIRRIWRPTTRCTPSTMQRKLRKSTWHRTAAARSIVGGRHRHSVVQPHLRSVAAVDLRQGNDRQRRHGSAPGGAQRPLMATSAIFGDVAYCADCWTTELAVLTPINTPYRVTPCPKLSSMATARARLTAARP